MAGGVFVGWDGKVLRRQGVLGEGQGLLWIRRGPRAGDYYVDVLPLPVGGSADGG